MDDWVWIEHDQDYYKWIAKSNGQDEINWGRTAKTNAPPPGPPKGFIPSAQLSAADLQTYQVMPNPKNFFKAGRIFAVPSSMTSSPLGPRVFVVRKARARFFVCLAIYDDPSTLRSINPRELISIVVDGEARNAQSGVSVVSAGSRVSLSASSKIHNASTFTVMWDGLRVLMVGQVEKESMDALRERRS